ncbi:MAG: hypothetical protein ACO1SX_01615, partial [Actinomycetota bacterium]
KTSADTPADTDLYGADKYVKSTPACPSSGTYTMGAVGTSPACSVADNSTAADASDDHVLP